MRGPEGANKIHVHGEFLSEDGFDYCIGDDEENHTATAATPGTRGLATARTGVAQAGAGDSKGLEDRAVGAHPGAESFTAHGVANPGFADVDPERADFDGLAVRPTHGWRRLP